MPDESRSRTLDVSRIKSEQPEHQEVIGSCCDYAGIEQSLVIDVSIQVDAAKETFSSMETLVKHLLTDEHKFRTYIASEHFVRLLIEALPQEYTIISLLLNVAASSPDFYQVIVRLSETSSMRLPIILRNRIDLMVKSLLAADIAQLTKEELTSKLCSILSKTWTSDNDEGNEYLIGIQSLLLSDMSPFAIRALLKSPTFELLLLLCAVPGHYPTSLNNNVAEAHTIIMTIVAHSEDIIEVRSTLECIITRLLATSDQVQMSNACSIVEFLCTIRSFLGVNLLSLEGFLEEVLAESEEYPQVNTTMLSMLSAACTNEGCRTLVSAKCSYMLRDRLQNPSDQLSFLQATIITYKLHQINTSLDMTTRESLGTTMLSLMRIPELTEIATEALMFYSLEVQTRFVFAKTDLLIKSLNEINQEKWPKIAYAVTVILSHLTALPEFGSVEEKQFREMASFASADDTDSRVHLESRTAITSRITTLVEQGLINVIDRLLPQNSVGLQPLLLGLLRSVASVSGTRVALAQIGSVKYLISGVFQTNEKTTERIVAGHALAKILISVDPNLIFNPARLSTMTAINALLLVLQQDGLGQLIQFEILLALTNLSSVGETECQRIISSWKCIEPYLLSPNHLLQRASIELVCNIVASQAGFSIFLSSKKSTEQILTMTLALSESSDFATRRAALGTLAVLSSEETVCQYLLKNDSRSKLLLTLIQDESEEIIHRGLAIILNICSTDLAQSRFGEVDSLAVLARLEATSKNANIRSLAGAISTKMQPTSL